MPLVLVFGPIRNFLNQHKHLLLLLFIMSVAKSAGLEKRLTLIFDTNLTEQCIQRSDSLIHGLVYCPTVGIFHLLRCLPFHALPSLLTISHHQFRASSSRSQPSTRHIKTSQTTTNNFNNDYNHQSITQSSPAMSQGHSWLAVYIHSLSSYSKLASPIPHQHAASEINENPPLTCRRSPSPSRAPSTSSIASAWRTTWPVPRLTISFRMLPRPSWPQRSCTRR